MPSNSSIENDPLINRRIKVGTFDVPITVANLYTGASVTLDALVDLDYASCCHVKRDRDRAYQH